MSQESSKVLTRQWKIIQFLLDSKYVSTADIEKHLQQQGMPTAQRTIQRDLNLLEKIFPVECRREGMPYSWRWKRIESSVKGLNLTQALILRLVDEELKEVLPTHMLTELEPLFQKAKLFSSNAMINHDDDTSLLDMLIKSRHRGVSPTSIFDQVIQEVGEKITDIYRDTFSIDERETRKKLQSLVVLLEQHDMMDLALALKN